MKNKTTKVSVTAEDIAAGKAGDCHLCPVARALVRVTGDEDANVYERDWMLWIEVWGRSILAPIEVQDFVQSFDDQLHNKSQRRESFEPFNFELPGQKSSEWQERCYRCEEIFAPSDLDEDGVCQTCTEK